LFSLEVPRASPASAYLNGQSRALTGYGTGSSDATTPALRRYPAVIATVSRGRAIKVNKGFKLKPAV
jgi:hypothetical protein